MAVQDGSFVLANKIVCVIKCQKGFTVPKRLKRFGVQYCMVTMLETFMDPSSSVELKDAVLDAFCKLLDNAGETGEGVLLYSFQDFLWSAFCVVAYFIRKYKWPVDKASALIKQKRPNIAFDEFMLEQLTALAVRVQQDPLSDLSTMETIAEEEMMSNTLENSKRVNSNPLFSSSYDDSSHIPNKTFKIRWSDDGSNEWTDSRNVDFGGEKRGILKRASSPAAGVNRAQQRQQQIATYQEQQREQQHREQQQREQQRDEQQVKEQQQHPLVVYSSPAATSTRPTYSTMTSVQQQQQQQQLQQTQRLNGLVGVSGVALQRPATPALRLPQTTTTPPIERRVFGKRLPPSPRRNEQQQELSFDEPIVPASQYENGNNSSNSSSNNNPQTNPPQEAQQDGGYSSNEDSANRFGQNRRPNSPGWLGVSSTRNLNNSNGTNAGSNSNNINPNINGGNGSSSSTGVGGGSLNSNNSNVVDTRRSFGSAQQMIDVAQQQQQQQEVESETPPSGDAEWLWKYRLTPPVNSPSSILDDKNNSKKRTPATRFGAMRVTPAVAARGKLLARITSDDRPTNLASQGLNSFLKIGTSSVSNGSNVNNASVSVNNSGKETETPEPERARTAYAISRNNSAPSSLWYRLSNNNNSSNASNGSSGSVAASNNTSYATNNSGNGNTGGGLRAPSPTLSVVASRDSMNIQRPLSASAVSSPSWNRAASPVSRNRSFVWTR